MGDNSVENISIKNPEPYAYHRKEVYIISNESDKKMDAWLVILCPF